MYRKPIKNIAGQRFGSLTVTPEYTRVHYSHGTKIIWKSICDCGAEYWMTADQLARRKTASCSACRQPGVRNSRLYHVYHGIKQRCYNANNPRYSQYGGRGIYMCDQWLNDYFEFEVWATTNGYLPDANLTIDRINNDGPYEPSNCRWIPLRQNTSLGNMGKVKHRPKLEFAYAISPDGEHIDIINVSEFARVNNLNRSSVNAALNGHKRCEYRGWIFFSNKSIPPRQKV